ncbi:MAG: SelT/SelW/SelH family protein [Nitrospinae bacterium]|nr:SelT/SelW/SelH family protein [Nitrospinota bacterium]
MAEEIKSSLGYEVELVAGSGGVFEVAADGKAVFSKHGEARFPDKGEVVNRLKRL